MDAYGPDGKPLDAHTIAMKAMNIAADMCVFTNNNFIVEQIKEGPAAPTPKSDST